MTRTRLGAAVATALSLCVGAAIAQAQGTPPSALSAADKTFVDKAGAGGAAEVALGRLATQKASNDAVKQFGQRMVDDHTRAGDELKQLASAKGSPPPATPTAKQQSDAAKLARLSGASFDKGFMNQMVLDHKQTIALFKKESKSGQDAELKAFAGKTLPTLQEHLRMVQTMQTKGGAHTLAADEAMPASAPR